MSENKLSRRDFLKHAALAASGVALVACQPQTVVVKETVEVEKEVEKVVTKEVEKIVKETVVVERTVAVPEGEKMSEVQELRMITPNRGAATLNPMFWAMHYEMTSVWAPLIGTTPEWEPDDSGLAEAWEVSDDGKAYTFVIRKNAKFSDGSPITAEEVAWSLRHFVMVAHPEPYGKRGNYAYARHACPTLLGAKDYYEGLKEYKEFGAADVEGIQVLDDFTLRLELESPFPMFLATMAAMFRVLKPENVMAAEGKDYPDDAYWNTEPDVAYSGLYKIESYTPGQGWVAVPNEYFWDDPPILKKIHYIFSGDINTAITAFQNKEADILLMNLGAEGLRQAYADPYLKECLVRPTPTVTAQFWITPYPPMDDRHVRRAVSMAVERASLLKVLNAGLDLWTETSGHFTFGNPICQEAKKRVKTLPFDPEQAKAELQKSKYWPDVVDMEINVIPWNNSNNPQVETVQKMLQDNLGLKNVKIRTETIADWTNPPFATHMWINGQGDWMPEPSSQTANMIHIMKNKPEGYGPDEKIPVVTPPLVPELIPLSEDCIKAATLEEKCSLLEQIWQIWNDEVFSLDYGVYPLGILVAPWVKEYRIFAGDAFQSWLKPGLESTWIAKH
jgi:ABC-type transport system substrate-binding protein